MLIEDNDEVINLVTDIVERFNIKLVVGHNTSDYVDLTKRFRFQCILCDINLDYKREGFDIVKIHKKRRLKSKIVAFTSSDVSPDLTKTLGFDFFLDKKPENFVNFLKKNLLGILDGTNSIQKKQPC